MSEVLPGLPAAPPAAKPKDASAVILYRRGVKGAEVFWIRRGAQLRFAAGFYAFPGGRVDRADATIPVEGVTGDDLPLVVAAARELFEEAGILCTTPLPKLSPAELAELRKQLLDNKISFAQLLTTLGAKVDGTRFKPAGRWVTPPFVPYRFDARFFLVEAPEGQSAEVWAGELAEGGWIAPAEGLALWREGKALLHPPNHHALSVMASFTTEAAVLPKLREPPHAPNFVAQRIEFQQGIHLLPVLTPTLPPATHTNCYLVGNGELVIVDPGSPDPREQAKLAAFALGLVAEGRRVKAIVLTHHHGDHIGGAKDLSERLKVPIWAHELTANRVEGVTRTLKDGEVITLVGQPTMQLTVLHTPGHARGHICLMDQKSKAILCGDMVAGLGTIVIDPPEGDLFDYLASLKRMRDQPAGVLYPAHGMAVAEGVPKLNEYVAHREMRVSQIHAALESGPLSIPELVAKVYSDTPKELHPLAERSALASLLYLARQGKTAREGEKFRRTA